MFSDRPASPTRRLAHALLWLVLMASLAFQVVPASGEGPAALDKFVYLPLVYVPPGGDLWGLVTDGGVPASGVPIDLWLYNGSVGSKLVTVTTNASGRYDFWRLPGLGAGQKYGVEYYNQNDPNHLFYWDTRDLTTYTANTSVNIGNFDIADIDLIAPASGMTVTLPYTFTWTPRPGVAGDNYEFNLYDYNNESLWFHTNGLGPVGTYQLPGLPAGFALNTRYVWEVWVYGPGGYGPDAAYGVSHSLYYIAFSSGPAGVVERLPAQLLPASGGPQRGRHRALASGWPGD